MLPTASATIGGLAGTATPSRVKSTWALGVKPAPGSWMVWVSR